MQGLKYSVWKVKVGYPAMIRVLIYVGGVYIKEVISNSEWVILVNNDGQPFAIYDIFMTYSQEFEMYGKILNQLIL